jgi:CBS domain-containing protein
MAVLFAILAVFGGVIGIGFNPFLLFIALFIYLGAREEARLVQMRFAFQGLPVRAAMMTRFHALNADDTVGKAADELLAGAQQDFPVVENGRVVGMVDRSGLVRALGERGRDARISEVMQRDCQAVQENEMLDKTFQVMREGRCTTLPVLRNQELVGLITLENVGELIMVQSALGNGRGAKNVASFHPRQ